MSTKRIEPKVLKGFRDYLPNEASIRRILFSKLSNLYELHGFSPIETPALEYSEILLGKGSDETDKQMFRFRDQGDRDVSLRFDLTVPLARFVAEHQNDLTFPFKRYHIGTVWRAEKPQRGRYREFTQCDFDIIGSNSSLADSEVLHIVASFFSSLNLNFTIRINHRGLLTAILETFNISTKKTEALRAIDKLDKIGKDGVIAELLRETNIDKVEANELLDLLSTVSNNTSLNESTQILKDNLGESELLSNSLKNLEDVFNSLKSAGYSEENFKLDITIARGLEYYTGIVFETNLNDVSGLGSVCSGGRYDDLASLYTSRKLPGVGGSVGIDRLLVGLEELQYFNVSKETRSGCLVANLDSRSETFKILSLLRKEGIKSELCPDDLKLGQQIKYADKKYLRFIIVKGEDERKEGKIQIKDLSLTENNQTTISESDLISFIKK